MDILALIFLISLAVVCHDLHIMEGVLHKHELSIRFSLT